MKGEGRVRKKNEGEGRVRKKNEGGRKGKEG